MIIGTDCKDINLLNIKVINYKILQGICSPEVNAFASSDLHPPSLRS